MARAIVAVLALSFRQSPALMPAMSATPACEHVFVICWPDGPRDNNEYFMACRHCGAEPAPEAESAPESLDHALECMRGARG